MDVKSGMRKECECKCEKKTFLFTCTLRTGVSKEIMTRDRTEKKKVTPAGLNLVSNRARHQILSILL